MPSLFRLVFDLKPIPILISRIFLSFFLCAMLLNLLIQNRKISYCVWLIGLILLEIHIIPNVPQISKLRRFGSAAPFPKEFFSGPSQQRLPIPLVRCPGPYQVHSATVSTLCLYHEGKVRPEHEARKRADILTWTFAWRESE